MIWKRWPRWIPYFFPWENADTFKSLHFRRIFFLSILTRLTSQKRIFASTMLIASRTVWCTRTKWTKSKNSRWFVIEGEEMKEEESTSRGNSKTTINSGSALRFNHLWSKPLNCQFRLPNHCSLSVPSASILSYIAFSISAHH